MRSLRRRLAALIVAPAVAIATTSCGFGADSEQKALATAILNEVPDDVARVLGLGDVNLSSRGKSGTDVVGNRTARLSRGPAPATTTGAWVAGCETLVAALSGTPGRLYGRMPGRNQLHEATADLCRRGIGYPLGTFGNPSLILGVAGADTAIDVDAAGLRLYTTGRDPRPRGVPLDVASPDPAGWDEAPAGEGLPWRYTSESGETQTGATFVVSAGTRLRAAVDCGRTGTSTQARVDPRPGGTFVTFVGSAGACQATHDLRPQLSYTTTDGAQVDRYDIIVMPALHLDRAGEPPVRTVTVS